MQVYLVGGAVRDQLLGIPVVDRDWVVVGSSESEMLELGYIPVGKDFPVFLHPDTKEEYALARRERKTGPGYGGFDFDTGAAVSLEDDLSRRDLTINAIAQDSDGALIDPYGGQADLAARKLRHVSSAFSEDPLRVLRVARFFARFHYLGFSVDSTTLTMMQAMSASGELNTLSSDRLWVEIAKGLGERSPDQFVEMLWQSAALRALLPEIADSFAEQDHLPAAEPNVRRRIFSALAASHKFSLSAEERWAVLCHAAGPAKQAKNIATVPPEKLQNMFIEKLCAAVSTPKLACRLAIASHALLAFVYRAENLKPDYVLKIFELCDAYRQSSILDSLLLIAQAINATDNMQPVAQLSSTIYLQRCFAACAAIKADKFVQHGLQGAAISEAINHARKMAVDEIKRSL